MQVIDEDPYTPQVAMVQQANLLKQRDRYPLVILAVGVGRPTDPRESKQSTPCKSASKVEPPGGQGSRGAAVGQASQKAVARLSSPCSSFTTRGRMFGPKDQ